VFALEYRLLMHQLNDELHYKSKHYLKKGQVRIVRVHGGEVAGIGVRSWYRVWGWEGRKDYNVYLYVLEALWKTTRPFSVTPVPVLPSVACARILSHSALS
jgi:hypothetical protein